MTMRRDDLAFAARAYNAPYDTLYHIDRLEGSGVNRWDSNWRAGHPSEGEFQFIPGTFSAFSRQARAANPEAWRGVPMSIKSDKAQALTTAWAITHGKGDHWSTYDRARRAGRAPEGGDASAGLGVAETPIPQMGRNYSILSGLFSNNPIMQQVIASYVEKQQKEAPESSPNAIQGPYQGSGIRTGFEARYGLRRSSGDTERPGVHVAGGYHYRKDPQGRALAYDYGDASNSPRMLNAAMRELIANPEGVAEAFYAPSGRYIKHGKVYRGAGARGHEDHLHYARER